MEEMSHQEQTVRPGVYLHHVHMVTHDMERTCGFYIEHFGGKIVFDDLIDGDRNVFMVVGKGRLHFFESRKSPPPERNAFHHLGMMVEDLDDFVGRLRRSGVAVSEIVRTPGGGFAMTSGPDNVKIELFEVRDPVARRNFVDE
ncbi:VOC family protein [Variovorax gossypii]|uniref:VOC family protein n=2 Tax=Comamonadaceae TaxID=80864 RepID=A0A3S0JA43_9BURK|nr:VOC family protein [Variovorax gossypii]